MHLLEAPADPLFPTPPWSAHPLTSLPTQPGLLNAGRDCWAGCGQAQGYCPTLFCGAAGACCRKGFPGSPWPCDSGERGCAERHCCGAASPPATPPLAFFGVAEAFDASICLFWWQSGALTAANWSGSDCTCERREALRARLSVHDHRETMTSAPRRRASSASPGVGTMGWRAQPVLNLSRQELEALSPGDVAFYRAAVRTFERRVHAVEAAVGHRFLHCDA